MPDWPALSNWSVAIAVVSFVVGMAMACLVQGQWTQAFVILIIAMLTIMGFVMLPSSPEAVSCQQDATVIIAAAPEPEPAAKQDFVGDTTPLPFAMTTVERTTSGIEWSVYEQQMADILHTIQTDTGELHWNK